jgi:hypothetical protein
MAVTLASCISTQKPPIVPLNAIDPKLTELGFSALVYVGRSSQMSISPADAGPTTIYFVGADRIEHSHPQIRAYAVDAAKDQRVTFQLGENSSPIYRDEQSIFYLSNTDEIKEQIFAEASEPGNEIYSHNLFSHRIDRLTYLPGPTGPFTVSSSQSVFFVQKMGQNYQLYEIKKDHYSYKKLIASLPAPLSWIGFRENQLYLLGLDGHQFSILDGDQIKSFKNFPTVVFAPVAFEKGWILSIPRANTVFRELVYWVPDSDCMESLYSNPDLSFEEVQIASDKAFYIVDGKIYTGPKPVSKKCK